MTICANNRRSLFGEVIEEKVHHSRIGEIVKDCWHQIPQHFPEVALDSFVIMPNHVHGIILLVAGRVEHARPLPLIVRSFKSAVSKAACRSIWQRNYYEHVIRDEDELNRIRDYIDDNPIMWSVDTENPALASIGANIPTTTR